jgi:nitroreductase
VETEETDYLLSTTRAVRKRLDLERHVEPQVILDCIRLSQQAPTGGNSQTWQWLVINDAETRAALAEIYRDASEAYFSAPSARTDPQTERVRDSALYLRDNLHRVPVHVIPLIQGRADHVPPRHAASFYANILPAAWSFQLALRARGLGSAWTTLHLLEADRAAELLRIPEDYTQVALFPVAYTIGTEFKPAKRPPVDSIVHWNAWKSDEG